MAVPRRDLNGPAGDTFAHLHACTLADYTAAGTTQPAVGDIVTPSVTGNWYVTRAANDRSKRFGEITKIEKAPAGTDPGYVVVDWLDAERVVELDTDDLTTVTLINSAIKDGDTTVGDNFDAGATTGPLCVVSKEGTGAVAGKIWALVFGS